MMTILVVAVGGLVLLYALYLGKDVKLSLRLLGTAAALEVRDRRVHHNRAVRRGRGSGGQTRH